MEIFTRWLFPVTTALQIEKKLHFNLIKRTFYGQISKLNMNK